MLPPPATPVRQSRALPPGRRHGRGRRILLWATLLVLLAVAQSLLVALTLRYERWRAFEAAEAAAAQAAAAVRSDLLRLKLALQALTSLPPLEAEARAAAAELFRTSAEVHRLEWRSERFDLLGALDAPLREPLFARIPRAELTNEADSACRAARAAATPTVSRSFFALLPGGNGAEVLELCAAVLREGRPDGFVVATLVLHALLDNALARVPALQAYELTFIEADGARLARSGSRRGAGVHVAEHIIDQPGQPLRLRADSSAGPPSLIPNLTLALVLGLSLALFGVVFLLARDVRRRAVAEQALAEALRFRRAMEDSLSTGLRARDMAGAITYVNPAFCAMVGFEAEALQAVRPPQPPPYWPPERAAEYAERQKLRLDPAAAAIREQQREGFETLFIRKNGERFPAMVYEAPLLDAEGRQTGWMGAVLDLSAQRRMEELSRQQQDRLQAAARLATVGEMASLLSHELNQPLAAIASYASGSLNLLEAPAAAVALPSPAPHGAPLPPRAELAQRAPGSVADGAAPAPAAPDAHTFAQLRQALARIAEQAERAGRIIKSVHAFVRRREQQREAIAADALLESVLPLVRLQARKSGTQVELDLPAPPAPMPRVLCDRTMIEQVLLNLARNGIQAMETLATPLASRRLVVAVRALAAQAAPPAAPARVLFEVIDAGPGMAPDVAAQLFNPFFTTRAEGMGLGLSLCRTVVEQHGGRLEFEPAHGQEGAGRGTIFRFTLPGAAATATAAAAAAAAAEAWRAEPARAPGEREAEFAGESGDTGPPSDP